MRLLVSVEQESIDLVQNTADTSEDLADRTESLDTCVLVVELVIVVHGTRLLVIDHEALFDCFQIVVGTSADLATLNETANKFVLWHVDVNEDSRFVTSLLHESLELNSLVECAGKTVKDQPFGVCRQRINILLEHANGYIVGNEVSLRCVRLNEFAEFAARGSLTAHHLSCAEVHQAVVSNNKLRLCALAATGSAA